MEGSENQDLRSMLSPATATPVDALYLQGSDGVDASQTDAPLASEPQGALVSPTPTLRFGPSQRAPPYTPTHMVLRMLRAYRAMSDPPPYTADAEEGTYTLVTFVSLNCRKHHADHKFYLLFVNADARAAHRPPTSNSGSNGDFGLGHGHSGVDGGTLAW